MPVGVRSTFTYLSRDVDLRLKVRFHGHSWQLQQPSQSLGNQSQLMKVKMTDNLEVFLVLDVRVVGNVNKEGCGNL